MFIGKAFYLNEKNKMTAEEFCKDKIAEEGFCFRGTMSKLPPDENCKCADHQCHVPQFDLGISTGEKVKGAYYFLKSISFSVKNVTCVNFSIFF